MVSIAYMRIQRHLRGVARTDMKYKRSSELWYVLWVTCPWSSVSIARVHLPYTRPCGTQLTENETGSWTWKYDVVQ